MVLRVYNTTPWLLAFARRRFLSSHHGGHALQTKDNDRGDCLGTASHPPLAVSYSAITLRFAFVFFSPSSSMFLSTRLLPDLSPAAGHVRRTNN